MVENRVFVYIWEYRVKKDSLSEFEKIYGPHGKWAELFRKDNGYLSTDLHKDITKTNRYITIDYWISKDARDSFRHLYGKEFKELDEYCDSLTEKEELTGDFYCFTDRFIE